MYRVIEVELGFLFDFYYARYRSPKETLIPDTVVYAAVVATSLCTLFSPVMLSYHRASAAVSTSFDIWLTRMVIVLFMALESFQYLALVFSDWHKVKMLCRYVRNAPWHSHSGWEQMLKFMCRVRLIRYWKNSVGQYSLLLACLPSQRIWRLPLPQWITGFLIRSRMTSHRRLPEEVKRAIYQFLRHGLTRLQYGEYALEKNGVLGLFYPRAVAIHKEISTAAQRILIWHIATEAYDSLWQQQQQQRQRVDSGNAAADGGGVRGDRLVATTLSAYCAYLVSSAPELLPADHSYNTRLLFDGVQCEAREALQGCTCRDDVYGKLPVQPDPRPTDSLHKDILPEGRRLSELLQQMPETMNKWKLLAELWVELLLSVAPSADNVPSHVQKLADGGELITHLWALLTHAGIIDKRTAAESNAFPV